MFRLEMKWVVPQKGFKMKLSINRGPYNGGTNLEFMISVDNCKTLSNLLWDWYGLLPEIVAKNIDIITVTTGRCATGDQVFIRVLLFGEKESGNSTELMLFNYNTQPIIKSEKKFKRDLNNKLSWFIKRKLKGVQKTEEILTAIANATPET